MNDGGSPAGSSSLHQISEGGRSPDDSRRRGERWGSQSAPQRASDAGRGVASRHQSPGPPCQRPSASGTPATSLAANRGHRQTPGPPAAHRAASLFLIVFPERTPEDSLPPVRWISPRTVFVPPSLRGSCPAAGVGVLGDRGAKRPCPLRIIPSPAGWQAILARTSKSILSSSGRGRGRGGGYDDRTTLMHRPHSR